MAHIRDLTSFFRLRRVTGWHCGRWKSPSWEEARHIGLAARRFKAKVGQLDKGHRARSARMMGMKIHMGW
jgi:hypothetical protein